MADPLPLARQHASQVNSNSRLFVLDLARCVAMIMMIQGHTLDALTDPQLLNIHEFPWNIWNFIRGLTAPVFLIVSGAVHVFSIKRDTTGRMNEATMMKRIRWALLIMSVGYLLVFPANRIFDLPYLNYEAWKQFFQTNILQLTGVALLLVVWASRSTRSVKSLGIVSAVVTFAIFALTPFMHAISWSEYMPEPISSFLSYQHGSLFPIFPFAGFLFAGVSFGAYLKSMSAEERDEFLLKKSAIYGAVLLAIAGIGAVLLNQLPLPNHDFMMSNPAFMFIRIGLILIIFSLMARLHRRLQAYREIYSFFSKHSFHVYIVHLLLIYGTPWFSSFGRIYAKSQSVGMSFSVAVGVIIVTLSSIYLSDYIQKNVYRASEIMRFSLGTMLVYALLR
ncbi:MAG: acyltransferase [Candidatus Kapaibacterium sp.]